jgi:hypothetical protein
MSGEKIGMHIQNPQRCDGDGEDCRLSELGESELFFRAVEAKRGQVETQGVIGFFKGLARHRKGSGECAAHTDAL